MSVFAVPLDIVRCVLFPFLTLRDLSNLSAVCVSWRYYIVKKYAKLVSDELGCDELAREGKFSILELLDLWQTGPSKLACGDSHAAMIGRNGSLYMWREHTVRSPLELPLLQAKSVSCGEGHSVVVTTDGAVFVQGRNERGQLGLGDLVDRDSLTKMNASFGKVSLAIAGSKFTLFLSKSNNTLYWSGELRVTAKLDEQTTSTPVEIPFKQRLLGEKITKVAAGSRHILVLTSHGRLLSAGSGDRNRLGRFASTEQPAWELHPVVFQNRPPKVAIVQISAGTTHSLVLLANGTVFAFGQSFSGELGLPSYRDAAIAQIIPNIPKAIGVAAGNYHSLILTAESNKILAFGYATLGQLGYRTSFWSSTFPQQSPLPSDEAKRVKFIAAGNGFSACMTGDARDLFTCGRSSLCAGAGPGVDNSLALAIFSRVPDVE